MSSPIAAKSKIKISGFKCAKCDHPLDDVIVSENKWSTLTIQCRSCKTVFDVCPGCGKLSLSDIDQCPHCNYLWHYVEVTSPICYVPKYTLVGYAICPQCDRLIELIEYEDSNRRFRDVMFDFCGLRPAIFCVHCSRSFTQFRSVSGEELQKRIKDEKRKNEERHHSLKLLIGKVKQMYKDPFQIIYDEDKSDSGTTSGEILRGTKIPWWKRLLLRK